MGAAGTGPDVRLAIANVTIAPRAHAAAALALREAERG
jgi:hypothetical protein